MRLYSQERIAGANDKLMSKFSTFNIFLTKEEITANKKDNRPKSSKHFKFAVSS